MANVTFLVAEDDLACEELIIGLPVLRHLQVDTHTLLKENRPVLDGADCSHVGNPTTLNRGGNVSRMMIARLTRISNSDPVKEETESSRPRVNYYTARSEEDPFPDPSLLDPMDEDQHDEIRTEVKNLKDTARENGLQPDDAATLDKMVDEHIDIFRTAFSSGRPALLHYSTED